MTIPHGRYPSLGEHFDRENHAPKVNLPIFASPSRPTENIFRIVYLRLIVAVATTIIVAALVANA